MSSASGSMGFGSSSSGVPFVSDGLDSIERRHLMTADQKRREQQQREDRQRHIEAHKLESASAALRNEAAKPDVAARCVDAHKVVSSRCIAQREAREAAVASFLVYEKEQAELGAAQRATAAAEVQAAIEKSSGVRRARDATAAEERATAVTEYVAKESAACASGKSLEARNALRHAYRAKTLKEAAARRQKWLEKARASEMLEIDRRAKSYVRAPPVSRTKTKSRGLVGEGGATGDEEEAALADFSLLEPIKRTPNFSAIKAKQTAKQAALNTPARRKKTSETLKSKTVQFKLDLAGRVASHVVEADEQERAARTAAETAADEIERRKEQLKLASAKKRDERTAHREAQVVQFLLDAKEREVSEVEWQAEKQQEIRNRTAAKVVHEKAQADKYRAARTPKKTR